MKLCLDAHERTGNERDLSWAAQAYMSLNDLDHAEALARTLLAGPLWGEGHRILSFVMLRRGAGPAARMHASLAVLAHLLAGDERTLTSDHVMLAQAAWKVGDFSASLEAADEALRLARRWAEPRNEVAAHMARADALRRMGDSHDAADALGSALARATEPCDVAWAYLKKGMCEMESDREELAMEALARAVEANGRCRSRQIETSSELNRARLLRRRAPRKALDLLDQIAKRGGELFETRLLRGYLAADRGALVEAEDQLARATVMEPPDADWPWLLALARAELAELRGGLLGDLLAEHRYRQSIAMVAALRGLARARAAYLVSSHRGPYDGLIGLLARSGRWRDALAVILELDASDMLRATATAAGPASSGAGGLDLGPPAGGATAPPLPTPPLDEILAAWRSRDLVIVIAPSPRRVGPGTARAYRLRIQHGEITGEAVGDAGEAQRWARALFADPGDVTAARALGAMIVPAEPTGELLHVLAIGPLGQVPLAALRDADGSLVLARRPVARVLALQETTPESRGTSQAVVLADPRGDLPAAAEEGRMVAKALGVAARRSGSGTGADATRERLWDARDADLLHVAAHVIGNGQRRALRLADGDVEPAEMLGARLAPRLAVLASCGSSAATDEEGWGSIAATLLEAGTAAVLATDRSVNDAASLQILRAFYAQPDWRADPARALARVQQDLAARSATSSRGSATSPGTWAAFSVMVRPPTVAAPTTP